ncbi:hypothetical protein [Thermus tengchongensis]|uniref:hypothetical protein n=1 Tax=Thermus tengchongensis TaxID=1214928 RepID=UPI00056EE9FA|nr:hypothetical protein [Thermus tengchongensis]
MDLRLALGLAEALERPSFPEGVGLEVYLDPGLLEEDEPFRQLAAKRPKRLSVHLPFWNLDLVNPSHHYPPPHVGGHP